MRASHELTCVLANGITPAGLGVGRAVTEPLFIMHRQPPTLVFSASILASRSSRATR
jgi:hypothetical protein